MDQAKGEVGRDAPEDLLQCLVERLTQIAKAQHGEWSAEGRTQREVGSELLYGDIGWTLVFMPRDRALLLAGINDLLPHVRDGRIETWGQLAECARAEVFAEYLDLAQSCDSWRGHPTRIPDRAETIVFDVGVFEDLDWPGWAAQEMLEWMPAQVIERFGSVEYSGVSGPCLRLPQDQEANILRALGELSYQCLRDDELATLASS